MVIERKKYRGTGCQVLDKAGIKEGDGYKGVMICLEGCPYDDCVLHRNSTDEGEDDMGISESTAICKNCGNIETLTFRDEVLVNTKRHRQQGDLVFHIGADPLGCACGVCTIYK